MSHKKRKDLVFIPLQEPHFRKAELDFKQVPSTMAEKEQRNCAEEQWKQEKLREEIRRWSVPEGVIVDYVFWAGVRTEAPVVFHLATALVAVGIVLGKKCEIQVGDLTLYPNFYVVCVGESTLVRKTHSIRLQSRILDKTEKKLQAPWSFYLSDDGTPEGLLSELREKQSGIKAFNEFGDFLKKTKKRDYLGGFAGLFTELYDCPQSYSKRLSQSQFEICSPFLCLEGASTREWLVDGMDESDIQGGFLARFLLFPGDAQGVELIPITPSRDVEEENRLADRLAELYGVDGTFQPAEEAKARYSDWYNNHRRELADPGMAMLGPYYGRLEGYVWKVALVFEVTRDPNSRIISGDSVVRAIGFVERLKQYLRPLILNDLQPSPWTKKLYKVRQLIQKAGPTGITRSILLKNSHLPSKELNEVTAWLEQVGEVRMVNSGGGVVRYYANSQLRD